MSKGLKRLKKDVLYLIYKGMLMLLFLFLIVQASYSQYKIRHDNDRFTSLTLGPEKRNGFSVSLSLVAMFTAGVSDRNGFRMGGGLELSQTVDNWTFSAGLDAYKATQNFGIGTSFAGATFDDGKYGVSYYVNKYYQGDKQVSGLLGVHLNDFEINFEDDILAYPFTAFKAYDRYRSAALEVRFKGFMIGTNVYTTDINGVTDVSSDNSRGIYTTGRQVSSPVYVGYTTNDFILRYGINNALGGVIGQSVWHRYLFSSPDFKSGNYNKQFIQMGIDKPYTLY